MSKEKRYALIDEYAGDFVGTMDEIMDWVADKNINVYYCTAYEVGDEVNLTISFKKLGTK